MPCQTSRGLTANIVRGFHFSHCHFLRNVAWLSILRDLTLLLLRQHSSVELDALSIKSENKGGEDSPPPSPAYKELLEVITCAWLNLILTGRPRNKVLLSKD